MDDIPRLAVLERRTNVFADLQDLRDRELYVVLLPVVEYVLKAREQFHADIQGTCPLALPVIKVIDGHDVGRAAKLLHDPDLVHEFFRNTLILELRSAASASVLRIPHSGAVSCSGPADRNRAAADNTAARHWSG